MLHNRLIREIRQVVHLTHGDFLLNMQVKYLFFILIVLLSFLPSGFAQDDRPLVYLAYIRASDLPPRPKEHVDAEIDSMIKKAQRFFADEMERHGFGRKTFQFEADANGNAIVHHVNGKFPYAEDTKNRELVEIQTDIPAYGRGRILVYMMEVRGRKELPPRSSGGGSTGGGSAVIYQWGWEAVAHELGHAFSLPHDHRSSAYIMSYTFGSWDRLSQCHAEWLDVHRAFNPGPPHVNDINDDQESKVKLLSVNLASPPNAIRFRFEVSDPDGLHIAQLLSRYTGSSVLSCKSLSGENSVVEFITTGLTPEDKEVGLRLIDVHGNITSQFYPIDVIALLPPPEVVSIPDKNLAAAVRKHLRLASDEAITTYAMLNLRYLTASNLGITDLTGLEHAGVLAELFLMGNPGLKNPTLKSALTELTQLTRLVLAKNNISDVSALAGLTQLDQLDLLWNNISDISALAGLTHLTWLRLADNAISDISPLAELTRLTDLSLNDNSISDISPLSGLTQLTRLRLDRNPISDISALAGLTRLDTLLLRWNNISDISALAGLTRLTSLGLSNNNISDVSALAGLTRLERLDLRYNNISDVFPLLVLNLTGTTWDSTGLLLEGNPLSYASINTHIPALQAKGIEVKFDNVAHPALLHVSGDAQEGIIGAKAAPFIVEVQDERGQPMPDAFVTFTLTAGEGILTPITTKTDANGQAQTVLTFGWTPSIYTVRATADGIPSYLQFTVTSTVLPDRLATDVNSDGTVDVEDMVLVAASFGTAPAPGTFPDTDVNDDGEVNHEDVLLVLAALEGAPAAPALDTYWTAASLQRWIAASKRRNTGDAIFQRGIAVLETLLADLLPKETALLANYPNPFNPETWIPYQLVKPAEVTLHIYSVKGELVQTLALGHQSVGIYHSKNRAAYWDGRNAQGECVASGVYFYTLSAGDFSATRKLLIRK